ncbi:MAG: DUF1573 domain-containing protein [Bacteroidetes bacterium]|nr:DUF1573 domain-containing protein [Bacteroidota bacterium]
MKKIFLIPVFLVGAMTFAQAQSTTTTTTTTAAPSTSGMQRENGPVMTFTITSYDFGKIKQGDIVTKEFKFKNTGKEPLIINEAHGSCGCTVPDWPKEPIKPNGEGVIKVTFNSTGKMGQQDKTVTITYDTDQTVVLHLTGTVEAPAATSTQGGGTAAPANGGGGTGATNGTAAPAPAKPAPKTASTVSTAPAKPADGTSTGGN